jgi:hypothetical protein
MSHIIIKYNIRTYTHTLSLFRSVFVSTQLR